MPRPAPGSRSRPAGSHQPSGNAAWTAAGPPWTAAARSCASTSLPPVCCLRGGRPPVPPMPARWRGGCIGQAVCRSCGRPGGYPALVIRWRSGTVTQLRREWAGTVEIMVTVHSRGRGPSHGPAPGGVGSAEPEISAEPETVRALAYPALTGRPEPGDRVLLNTTALHQGLGTGGYALVVAIPDRLPPDPELTGHVVKARYTPLQATVTSVDEQGSPHHDLLRDADSIDGMPVVVADLHSALPAILAGLFCHFPKTTP